MKSESIGAQFKHNFVAILSLFVAIVALTYTAWREDTTEKNRNTRQAAFEVLKHLGELQLVINYGHYQPENSLGNPILGWGHIAIIGDMGDLLPAPIPEKTKALVAEWRQNWQKLSDEASTDDITKEIDSCREVTVDAIHQLR